MLNPSAHKIKEVGSKPFHGSEFGSRAAALILCPCHCSMTSHGRPLEWPFVAYLSSWINLKTSIKYNKVVKAIHADPASFNKYKHFHGWGGNHEIPVSSSCLKWFMPTSPRLKRLTATYESRLHIVTFQFRMHVLHGSSRRWMLTGRPKKMDSSIIIFSNYWHVQLTVEVSGIISQLEREKAPQQLNNSQ